MARFKGTDDDDRWAGTGGADVAFGRGGGDRLAGHAGNDTLVGGAGADTLLGGVGRDILYAGAADPDFDPSRGVAGVSHDTGREIDTLIGGEGNDYIFAGVGDNADGGDPLAEPYTDDHLYISFAGATEGVHADFVELLHGPMTVAGGVIQNFNAVNYIQGSAFDDVLSPFSSRSASAAVVDGGAGDDTIGTGGAGRGSQLFGGDGDDTITARYAEDTADGGDGDDRIAGTGETHGGTGDDIIQMHGSGLASGDAGNDLILGYRLTDDEIDGGEGDDRLVGGFMADVLRGGEGIDRLEGSRGDDVLIGGPGSDRLYGGRDADTFLFQAGDLATDVHTADRIEDFDRGEGDRIDLSAIDAVPGTVALDPFSFIGDAAFSGTAGELRYGFVGGNTLVEGDTDGDGIGDVFLRLNGHVALVAQDLVLTDARPAELPGLGLAIAQVHAMLDAQIGALAFA